MAINTVSFDPAKLLESDFEKLDMLAASVMRQSDGTWLQDLQMKHIPTLVHLYQS